MALNGRGFRPFSAMRDDEDPFESCAAEIELASSRATTTERKIAEQNGNQTQVKTQNKRSQELNPDFFWCVKKLINSRHSNESTKL
ncbi:hypothetical protein [Secundilactobacillus paracollinoides]|uniref:hypothetical protein n=2 Tax=Secundilactobacillus paracollinoides TaxID=240427 RepID=UPI0006D1271E|nr:hypothetical protein [Secundilactobacillus paracollinoides]